MSKLKVQIEKKKKIFCSKCKFGYDPNNQDNWVCSINRMDRCIANGVLYDDKIAKCFGRR